MPSNVESHLDNSAVAELGGGFDASFKRWPIFAILAATSLAEGMGSEAS